MGTNVRSVVVKKLPESISVHREQVYNDLESSINVDRPAVVLDCSAVRQFDRAAIHLLLCCLEEAMKRNGDVRLAGLTSQAKGDLRAAEVDSLFQTFESLADAIDSFHRPQFDFIQLNKPMPDSQKSRMNAA
jgi:anti-anti-sigma regulatory factor